MDKNMNQKSPILMLNSSKPDDVVNIINENVSGNGEITIDISSMNLLDACKVSILCSTKQYMDNPKAHINWIVSSSSVADMASSMSLGNSSFLYD